MGVLIIVVRALHIVGGVFWAGAAILLYGFVVPSVAATRPDSNRFMQHLAGKSGLTFWMTVASWATVVGGLALFAPVTGDLEPAIMRSPRGMALSLGALLALAAFLEGNFVTAPNARKVGAIAREFEGKAPTPEQLERLQAAQRKMVGAGTRGAWMLGAAALLMAIARYL